MGIEYQMLQPEVSGALKLSQNALYRARNCRECALELIVDSENSAESHMHCTQKCVYGTTHKCSAQTFQLFFVIL